MHLTYCIFIYLYFFYIKNRRADLLPVKQGDAEVIRSRCIGKSVSDITKDIHTRKKLMQRSNTCAQWLKLSTYTQWIIIVKRVVIVNSLSGKVQATGIVFIFQIILYVVYLGKS